MMRLPALALATLLLQADALTPRPDGHANVLQAADACIDVTIVMNTKKWASEVSWTITSPSNSAVSVTGSGYGNNKVVYKQACLPVASGYLLTMIDSYGDGWNGGKIRVYLGTHDRDTLPSSPEVTGELPSGSQGTQSFALPLPAAPSAPAPAPDALDIALEAKLAEWNLLGFSVAYFKRGAYSEPIARGYGKTDANPSKASPVTGDTVQMIASMSKTILGATVAKLIDSGDIGLDDDIKNTLPSDWPAVGTSRNPKDSSQKPVTWRHILTHSSSMRRDVSDMSRSYGPTATLPSYLGKKGNPTCPVDDLIGFYGDYLIDRSPTTPVGAADGGIDWYESAKSKGTAWFDYKPGDAYEYSNLATGYLGLLVELAAKKSTNFPSHLSYEQFSKHTVFDPLKMTNTAWFRKDLPSSCSEATPADWHKGKHENIGHYCFIDYASGQLHTSARDLAKFGQSWIDYGKGFISPATGKQAVGCTSRAADGSIPADDDCKMGHLWFRLTNGKRDKGKSSHLDPVRALDWTDGVGHGGAEMGPVVRRQQA